MIWRERLVIVGLGLCVGCGPKSEPSDGGPGGTSETGDGSTGADTLAASSAGDGGSTMEATPGDSSSGAVDATTGATSAADTAATDVDDGSASDSETGEPMDDEYSAQALPGGLDRLRILKRDLVADRCMWIVLVAPKLMSIFRIDTPKGWSVESVRITDGGPACDFDTPEMGGFEDATAASGTITFRMPGAVYPCTVDIDASADFAGTLPGIPPTDTMTATGIPVAGC